MISTATEFHWKVDECAVYFDRMRLRGWAFHAPEPIVAIGLRFVGADIQFRVRSFGLASPDVAAAVDRRATRARFDEWVIAPPECLGEPFVLLFTLADGTTLVGEDALTNCAWGDPHFQIWEDFVAMLDSFGSGTVLEVGSRARSGVVRRNRIPAQLAYVGLDILPGPNVDIVGDAHQLSALLPKKRFVAAFSTSVFEHLAMPWKVAIELNRVLDVGGLVFTSTHQTWPVHDAPWDFWRFSQYAWKCLFNAATGFEIVSAVVGEPARVHPCRTSALTRSMPESLAYLGSSCIARKIADTALRWDVALELVADARYPAGEVVARL